MGNTVLESTGLGSTQKRIDQFHVVRYCFLNNALSLYGSYDCT